MNEITLRPLRKNESEALSQAFKNQGWNKPASIFEAYYKDQESGIRDVIIADYKGAFAGFLTVQWEANYLPFKEKGIPEIVNFNVLKKFQRKGIGTKLMDEAERRIAQVADYAGIGFGVTQDYGAAQILYIKRGYIPDGKGMTLDSRPLPYMEVVTINDDLVFALLKRLR